MCEDMFDRHLFGTVGLKTDLGAKTSPVKEFFPARS